MTSVVIADDHGVVRAGLRALVAAEPDLELIGEASGGYEAIDLVEKNLPDVLVLDLSMPDLDGIAVTRELHGRFPGLRILILTIHEDEALLREAVAAGAAGYILKRAAERELIAAIGVVCRGDLYVDPGFLRDMLGESAAPSTSDLVSTDALTVREKDVLRLIAQGYTNRQIGEQLSISVRTVEGHRANIQDKLDLHSRVELIRFARKNKLL